MELSEHTRYMQMALDLSRNGIGRVNPNPLVGAVIVKDGQVIGKGFHGYFGGPHAEVEAVRNAGSQVDGATLYVTLEPCSHFGKTPPCTDLLIKENIKRVVIAMVDPNPLVSGKGIEKLRQNGIEVITGVMETEARTLNRVFVKYITQKKPYVLLKTAMSLDGKTATRTGDSKWISCEVSRHKVHELRNELKGILAGINTILQDNPELTCRLTGKTGRNPVRIIADTHGRIPLTAKVLSEPRNNPSIILTSDLSPEPVKEALMNMGHTVINLPVIDDKTDLKSAMTILADKGIDGILLEGGGTLNEASLKAGIVDEIWTFVAPVIIGGVQSLSPVGGKGFDKISEGVRIKEMTVEPSGVDFLIKAMIEK